jgi:hypothetical protein
MIHKITYIWCNFNYQSDGDENFSEAKALFVIVFDLERIFFGWISGKISDKKLNGKHE